MPPSRSLAALGGLLLAGALLAPLGAGPAQAAPDLDWQRRADGLATPTHVTSARDGSGRLFVTEKAGTVRVVKDGRVLRRPFLDIRGRVRDAGEAGLLSIAFHPRYRSKPFVYAAYVTRGNDLRVARFRAGAPGADRVRASTGRKVLTVPHPRSTSNHFAGQIAFDRGGRLLVSTGDGGGSGDPGDRAGNLRSLQGKLLRIDVLGARKACGRSYCVPRSNPYRGATPGRGEVWASGLRNTWRFSVDPATGDLWLGDVGQGGFEEVDRVPAGTGGLDFGWSCREGFVIFDRSHCRAGTEYEEPVAVYGRDFGSSVTGGFVYRGSRHPELVGTYVGGDFGSGRVFTLEDTGVSAAGRLDGVTSFGEDEDRELWAVTIDGSLWEAR